MLSTKHTVKPGQEGLTADAACTNGKGLGDKTQILPFTPRFSAFGLKTHGQTLLSFYREIWNIPAASLNHFSLLSLAIATLSLTNTLIPSPPASAVKQPESGIKMQRALAAEQTWGSLS